MGRTRIWAGAAVLALAVAACGGDTAAETTTTAPADATTTTAAPDTTAGGTETTQAGETCSLRVADFDSGDVRAAHYAINEGIVTSDLVTDIQIDYLALPALIQNTASPDYDITSTSLSGVVFASVQGEVDLQVTNLKQNSPPGGTLIYTAADSDVQAPEDLVGRTLGVTSLGSTTTMATQMVLEGLFGIDADPTTGQVAFAELDPPTLLNAIQNGDVDAGELFYNAAYQAESMEGLRVVLDKSAAYEELTGHFYVGGGYVVRPETLEEKRDCIAEAQRMFEEAGAYYDENPEEVAEALESEGLDPGFLIWWAETYDVGATLDQEWADAAVAFWERAHASGFIPENPDPDEVFFRP